MKEKEATVVIFCVLALMLGFLWNETVDMGKAMFADLPPGYTLECDGRGHWRFAFSRTWPCPETAIIVENGKVARLTTRTGECSSGAIGNAESSKVMARYFAFAHDRDREGEWSSECGE